MSIHSLRAAEAIANGVPPKTQREYVAWLEKIISNAIDEERLSDVRWYHSSQVVHPVRAEELAKMDATKAVVQKADKAWSDTYRPPDSRDERAH